MTAYLAGIFASDRYLPHGLCLLWEPWLVWLHVVSDSLVALSSYSIPVALLYFIRRRTDFAFRWVFALFIAFLLAGGTTRLLGVSTLWNPAYGLEGLVKAATAVVSVAAAVSLWAIMPRALALPAVGQLERMNRALAEEIAQRRKAEQALRDFNAELERRVAERTSDLVRANAELQQEISQRRSAEAALTAGEQRFRDFAEIASDWMWEMDADLRFTYVSQRAAEISGVPAEESIGRTRAEVADSTYDPERFRRHLEDLKARRPFRDLVFARRTKTRERRYARVSGQPIFDADGTFRGYRGVASDVTMQIVAEQRAAAAHARLVDAIEALPAAFMLFDNEERLVLANRRHLETYAPFPDVTKLGTKFETMVREMARQGLREDAARNPETYVKERLAQFRGSGFEGEVKYVDGRWFHHVERRTSEGGVVSIRMDITARKRTEEALRESEQRFRAIVDNAPMVIFLKDRQGRYLLINRAFERWSNVIAAQVQGKTAYDLYSREFADLLTQQDRRVIDTGVVLSEEIDLPHSDGTVHHVISTKFPILDAEGKVTGVGGFNVDLTQMKQVEEQLRQAQKMEAVGQLTGGIAHDFNNLLTVVLGNLDEIVERLPADHSLKPIAVQAVAAAERGAMLTQKLLAFARRQPLRPQPVDCNDVVKGMAELLRRTLGEQVEIRTELAASLPVALADRGQVENALLNLAINARDAMSDGGRVVIETALIHLDMDYTAANPDVRLGDYVMLAVTDTGAGMTAEVKARAFEPFFTTKEVGKGSGMGLSMIYGFAKQSGGHVKLYSEVNQGTTVRLYLPVASGGTAKAPSPGASLESLRARMGETVLVVEDDELVRGTVVRLLDELGYRVLESEDAASALTILNGPEKIDLLFTDVVLPGPAGGRQLAEEATRRRPGLKVLFTSGYTQNSIVHHGRLDAGVQLLSKPYKKEVLARTVRRVIDGGD